MKETTDWNSLMTITLNSHSFRDFGDENQLKMARMEGMSVGSITAVGFDNNLYFAYCLSKCKIERWYVRFWVCNSEVNSIIVKLRNVRITFEALCVRFKDVQIFNLDAVLYILWNSNLLCVCYRRRAVWSNRIREFVVGCGGAKQPKNSVCRQYFDVSCGIQKRRWTAIWLGSPYSNVVESLCIAAKNIRTTKENCILPDHLDNFFYLLTVPFVVLLTPINWLC